MKDRAGDHLHSKNKKKDKSAEKGHHRRREKIVERREEKRSEKVIHQNKKQKIIKSTPDAEKKIPERSRSRKMKNVGR